MARVLGLRPWHPRASDPQKESWLSREFDCEFATMVTDIQRMLVYNTEDKKHSA